MYTLDVIPLIKMPASDMQVLTYFSREKLPRGAVVRVAISKRNAHALVIACRDIGGQKTTIKKSRFAMRNITGIVTETPVLAPWQFTLLKWLSDYYIIPLPQCALLFVPAALAHEKTKRALKPAATVGVREHAAPQAVLLQKTERMRDYRRLITDCLARGRSALLLVPEMALAERYGKELAEFSPVMLSGMQTRAQSFKTWNAIRIGEARCVIGARSAVFASFSDLGLVIVDEEHNPSYKSWDMFPYYHARSVAEELARVCNAQIIYGSDAPSPETRWRADEKQYTHIPEQRADEPKRPMIVDMRNELFGKNYSLFSHQLQTAMRDALERTDARIFLFVPRRGSEHFSWCGDCGAVERCERCGTHLVLHREPSPRMICHACGWTTSPRLICSACGSHAVRTFGAGTHKVSAEIKKEFGVSALIIDADTAPTQRKQTEVIAAFSRGDAPVLIGTQAALGKNMPPCSVCAVISLDHLLYIPDFSVSERLFHAIRDMGRLCANGAAFFIQSHIPENETLRMAAAQDYEAWYSREIGARQELRLPPFSHIVKVVVKEKTQKTAEQTAAALAVELKNCLEKEGATFELLGPAPAYYQKTGHNFTQHIIVKLITLDFAPRIRILRDIARRATVDVDPMNII